MDARVIKQENVSRILECHLDSFEETFQSPLDPGDKVLTCETFGILGTYQRLCEPSSAHVLIFELDLTDVGIIGPELARLEKVDVEHLSRDRRCSNLTA